MPCYVPQVLPPVSPSLNRLKVVSTIVALAVAALACLSVLVYQSAGFDFEHLNSWKGADVLVCLILAAMVSSVFIRVLYRGIQFTYTPPTVNDWEQFTPVRRSGIKKTPQQRPESLPKCASLRDDVLVNITPIPQDVSSIPQNVTSIPQDVTSIPQDVTSGLVTPRHLFGEEEKELEESKPEAADTLVPDLEVSKPLAQSPSVHPRETVSSNEAIFQELVRYVELFTQTAQIAAEAQKETAQGLAELTRKEESLADDRFITNLVAYNTALQALNSKPTTEDTRGVWIESIRKAAPVWLKNIETLEGFAAQDAVDAEAVDAEAVAAKGQEGSSQPLGPVQGLAKQIRKNWRAASDALDRATAYHQAILALK
jgi:hypothetical protein